MYHFYYLNVKLICALYICHYIFVTPFYNLKYILYVCLLYVCLLLMNIGYRKYPIFIGCNMYATFSLVSLVLFNMKAINFHSHKNDMKNISHDLNTIGHDMKNITLLSKIQ